MNSERKKLTVLIITLNEEKNLPECIDSVKWADEIIVVDSFSTDRTVEIAKEFGAKVIQRGWDGFANQRKYSLQQASSEWILFLDADERITNELRLEIEEILSKDIDVNGYKIPRKNYFLGKWIRSANWYPDYQMRLFRKSKASIIDVPIHEGVSVEGMTGVCKKDMIHLSYQSLEQAYCKINHYTTLAAIQRMNKKVSAVDIILHPIGAFLTDYISRKAYRDGFHGFLVAMINLTTNLMTYTKIWEMQRRGERIIDN